MTEYVKKVEFSDMEENMRLLKWKNLLLNGKNNENEISHLQNYQNR